MVGVVVVSVVVVVVKAKGVVVMLGVVDVEEVVWEVEDCKGVAEMSDTCVQQDSVCLGSNHGSMQGRTLAELAGPCMANSGTAIWPVNNIANTARRPLAPWLHVMGMT